MAVEEWERDLATSTRQFQEIVWPNIKGWFGEDPELYATENKDDPLLESLDRVSGVDFWLVDGEVGMASIASRVQDQYDETTFTVRYARKSGVDTEHQKRLRQLNQDYHLPTWTVQAYVEPTLRMLQNAAACRTAELFEYVNTTVEPGSDNWPLIRSNEDEHFYAIDWGELDGVATLRVYDRDRAGLRKQPDDPGNIRAWAEAAGEDA